MPESEEFWDFYWETRLREIEDLGKREAILAASKLIRQLAEEPGQPVRLLELGCGEGQVIGPLVEAFAQVPSIKESCGVDYSHRSIEKSRRAYPEIHFIEGDFTDRALLARLGQFEIVLLVNALHEVFSVGLATGTAGTAAPEAEELNVQAAKQRAEQALAGAASCLAPEGYLILFDGLESPGDPRDILRIRFRHWEARRRFESFAHEYRPFRIHYQEVDGPLCVELSRRDFTRYIDKSIFLGKALWQTERLESYQYFNEAEFRQAFDRLGLAIRELRLLTVNYEKWLSEVEIETPGEDFPDEHILIVGRKPV